MTIEIPKRQEGFGRKERKSLQMGDIIYTTFLIFLIVLAAQE